MRGYTKGWPIEYLKALAAIVGIFAIMRSQARSRCTRIGDVDEVVIEGGQRPDSADHYGHRVGVTAETGKNRSICSWIMVW